jgi:Cof subfamily protein (haloacid dehalogenase superfamily)
MIKALISDYDGTLTDHNHQLSESAHHAIINFIAKGKIFSIATGRMYQGVVGAVAKQLDLKDPIIVRGGSEIVDPRNGQVLWAKYIEEEVVSKLIDFLNSQKHIEFAAESGDLAYTQNGKIEKEFGAGTQFGNLNNIDKTKIPKVVVFPAFTESVVDELIETISKQLSGLHLAKITSRRGFGIDINSNEAGKENALLVLSKLLKLDLQEMAGIGDGHNDYPLLINCGFKIAMGNAPEQLKSIADEVVATQEKDGIVEAIGLILNRAA